MKFLVIGFGKMGMLHAATLRTLPGVTEVLIAETSPLVRRGIRAFSPNTRVFSDYRETLKEKNLAGAVIATPTASHVPILKELLPAFRGIFVEKPFASSFAEAEEAARLASGADRSIMTGHCLRFAPAFVEAKRLLDQGVLGSVQNFEASMFSSDVMKRAKSWRFKTPGSGGGVLLDLGSHLVDMVRYFFGTPNELTGRIRSIVSTQAEDAFESRWTYDSGLTGAVEGSWSRPNCRKASLTIAVHGANGRMDIFDDAVELDLKSQSCGRPAGTSRLAVTSLETPVKFDLAGPMYTRQLESWVNSLSDHNPLSVNTLEENLTNLRLIDAIRRSGGSPVGGFVR